MIKTYNNKLIVEAYDGSKGLRHEIRGGIAFVDNKSETVGLKVLAEAVLNNGDVIPAGSTAYVKENILSGPVAKDIRMAKSALGDAKFIEIDLVNICFIDVKGKE
jgi:hypothetical protein